MGIPVYCYRGKEYIRGDDAERLCLCMCVCGFDEQCVSWTVYLFVASTSGSYPEVDYVIFGHRNNRHTSKLAVHYTLRCPYE